MRRSPLLTLPLLLAGCDDTIFGVTGEDGATLTQIGYAGVEALSENNCMPCHSAAGNAVGNGLDLETDFYAATVNVASTYGDVLVVPSDPQASLLYLKMAGTNPSGTGSLMPPAGELPASSLKIVEDWILAGALEE